MTTEPFTTEPFTTEEFTTEEKQKLAGIEERANNYVHPTTHLADMISDTAEKVMMTQAERNALATISMFTSDKVNDALDKINGEVISGGTPGKLEKLEDTKEAIREAINRTGVEVAPEEPFASYPEKISAIPPVDDWQLNPTWWDIETILKEDIRDYAYKSIYLYPDSDSVFNLYGGQASATSDGAFYNESYPIHTWNSTKDKQCVENGVNTYKTRYVIVYSNQPHTTYPFPSSGDNTLLGAIVTGPYTRALSFYNCPDLQFIKLGEGVSELASRTFDSNASLRSISLPESVVKIGDNAFSGCGGLRSIKLPDQITILPANSFQSCYSLSFVDLPAGLISIQSNAFAGCYSLASIELPDSITTIGEGAFGLCYGLERIELPASLQSIGKNCFQNCSRLKSVKLPLGLQVLPDYLFNQCTSITKFELPASVTSLGNTFLGLTQVSFLVIPASVTAIRSASFTYCLNLRSVILENTVNQNGETIMFEAFLDYVSVPPNFDIALSIKLSNLSVPVLLQLLNHLKDNTGLTAKTLALGTVNSKKLTDEQKAIATNKNWVLA